MNPQLIVAATSCAIATAASIYFFSKPPQKKVTINGKLKSGSAIYKVLVIRLFGDIDNDESSIVPIGNKINYDKLHGSFWQISETFEAYPKKIIFMIDSNGGSIIESQRMFSLLQKQIKVFENAGSTVQLYIAGNALSGGYYLSLAFPHITCSKASTIGSIGSYVEFHNYDELYKKIGIQEISITSSKYKKLIENGKTNEDALKSYKKTILETNDIFSDLVVEKRGEFVKEYAKSEEAAESISAFAALRKGLIDAIDDEDSFVYDNLGFRDVYVYSVHKYKPAQNSSMFNFTISLF